MNKRRRLAVAGEAISIGRRAVANGHVRRVTAKIEAIQYGEWAL